MTGCARGRGVARGRGRGAPPTTGTGDAARRPGTAPVAQPTARPAGGGGTADGTGNGNGAGRASNRGGARGEHRPGAGVANLPTTAMAQLSIGTGDGKERRNRREISFSEPNTRPANLVDKKGFSGKPIPLLTNYYSLDARPGWQMYHYHVEFNPPIDSKKLRKGLIGEHADKLFQSYLFDGMQLFSSTKLPKEVTEFFAVRKYDDAKIRVTVKRVAELPAKSHNCLHVFNILMRQILFDMGMKDIQRSFFSPDGAIKLSNHGLEIWPGFKTSILHYEESVLLNLDISHKVLRTESVLQTMYRIHEQVGKNLSRFKELAMKELVGQSVLTRYNAKTYRIDDIDWDIHPGQTFKKKDQDITYQEYYKEAYNIDVKDPNQPMLVSRVKKREQREGAPELLYLLPELCTRTGLTDGMRANFNLMKDMAVHTRIDPARRVNTLSTFREQLESSEQVQKRFKGWDVKFSKNLVQLQGRTLDPEKIILGPDGRTKIAKTVMTNQQADWGRDMRGRLYTTVNLNNWVVVYWRNNEGAVNDFFENLRKVAPPMGITLQAPYRLPLDNSSIGSFLGGIKSVINPNVQLVLAILPSNKKDMYDAIKKQCCIETPVPSQCVTFNVLKRPKGLMSVVTKIAIQINCKLAGEAWALVFPLKRTMVIGIDTYHDSSKKGRSVAGFVASLNGSFTRYYSQTIFQSNMQELCDGLKLAMTAALRKYHSVNNTLPEKIFVYRDGVGDGQLPAVVEHEVSQILDGAQSLGSGYKPKVTVIVVKKRISSKFFSKGPRGLTNPPPGTIIDNTVTRAESYDFFLVAQSVGQGTVTPTHYNVIWDENSLKPDHLQQLSYKLCHLYYNWPGTIRVPAPCQYAHKLAFLTGQSLHRTPDLSLADKLYFL